MLYFKTGCMNSSKTMNLIMAAYNYEERGFLVQAFKTRISDRGEGDNVIKSRAGGNLACIPIDNTFAFDLQKLPDVIFIDEAQFLSKEQVERLYDLSSKIPVLCYGLKTDFRREMFEGSKRLLELADSVEEFKTICECGRKATINARLEDGKIVREGKQVAIEGEVQYKSLCRFCYDKGIS